MDSTQTVIKMILDRWYGALKSFDNLLNSLSDEQLQKEISSGKNRGVYILGHLIAVHDDMIILMGLGDKVFPELHNTFIASPDKSLSEIPSAQELRSCWSQQCEVLKQIFDKQTPDEWLEKHTAVSAEDFIKEPHRNKLNILLTRTTHLTYHTGQLILLK